ncbi:hypothetical protein D9M73_70830 [compost metagenome]
MSNTRVLTRNMKVGETITFDNGRIVVRLEERTGRSSARIRCELSSDVVVTKPGEAPAKPKDTETVAPTR